jgi:hypothetical protein
MTPHPVATQADGGNGKPFKPNTLLKYTIDSNH